MPTMTWVDEVEPTVVQHGSWENPDERAEFLDEGLTPEMRSRLMRLADEEFDAGFCEAADYRQADNRCTQPVGYGLSGDADEHTTWHPTTVVQVGSVALVVCEDDSPTNIYPIRERS